MANKSYLFISGNKPANIQNADIFDADAVIFDIEDAVAPDEKDAARHLIRHYLSDLYPKDIDVYVRINGIDSVWFDSDMASLDKTAINGVVLPKATEASIVACEQKLKTIQKDWGVIALIESPRGLTEVTTIAAHPVVEALMFGAEDYSLAMNITRHESDLALNHARNMVALSAKAYGKEAIDTPYPDMRNQSRFEEETKAARRMGFTGKACIHPSHVAFINKTFLPSEDEIIWAKKILAAEKKHQNEGVFALDGAMIDEPIIAHAKGIITEVNQDE